jgi:hypothetical protein
MSKLLLEAVLTDYDRSLRFTREVSCFLVPEQGILSLTTDNNFGSVTFDFFCIWEKVKASFSNPKTRPPAAIMIHTHPEGYCKISPQDRNMIYGWVKGLGIPIFYIVVVRDEYAIYLCKKVKDSVKITKGYAIRDFCKSNKDMASMSFLFEIMYSLSSMDRRLKRRELSRFAEYLNKSCFLGKSYSLENL